MVTHVVLFKMKDRSGDSARRVQEALLSMRGRIPGLIDLQAGIDFAKSDRSYDVALVTKHESRQALDAYQVHPVHEVVKKLIHELRDASIAVDYEE